jgi:hypothetical protein
MATVLVTGASGGFGYEFACQLERQGYRLLLHGRDEVRLQLTLDALEKPEQHRLILGELAARKDVERLVEQLEGEAELTGLVNNAGFGIWGGFRLCESVAQLDVLRVDLVAPVALTHALLPVLSRNNGFVINVSSLAGETPLPYMSTYAAAKAGLTYWSEALRAEEQGRLRVVTLAPGPSPTNFRRVSGAPAGKGSLFSTPAEAVVAISLRMLERGGGYCVPGLRHRALWLLQKLVPRRFSVPVMARYLEK